MEVQETLNTLAEIFIAVAGFTAVMIVLRSDTTSKSTSLIRMVATVSNSFASAACALLPIALQQLFDNTHIVYGIPIGILAAWHLVMMTIILFLQAEGTLETPWVKIMRVFTVTTALISVLLLVISVGLWMESNAAVLILALIWYLILQGYGFISNLVWAASRE